MTDNEFKELIDKQVCHIGEGFPASTLGKEFDLYIDKQTHRFYRKSNDVWTSAPKEVIGQCVSYLKKDDLKEVVDEFLVASGDASALVKEHNANADAHLTGFNHRLTSNQLFDYNLLPNTDFIQKGHLEERIKDSQGLKEHAETVASTTDLGHVKVDGNSIVVEDGVAKAIGGKLIGEIFAYPSKVPPEGAYLLDGQTIYGCDKLYPEFYNWVITNKGEVNFTPIYNDWVMPSLSQDGSLGGLTYGVEASSAVVSGYDAYKSFDNTLGGASTFTSLNAVKEGSITFYSPKKIEFTSVKFVNPTAGTVNQRIIDYEIEGSNDNTYWDRLAIGAIDSTANSAEQIVDIPLSNYDKVKVGYKYIRISGTNGGGTNCAFPEITLYGKEFVKYDYTTDGNILVLSNVDYDLMLKSVGCCGAFALDETSGDVRLPYAINATLWGADYFKIGESLPAGLPNIVGEIQGNATVALMATHGGTLSGSFGTNGSTGTTAGSGSGSSIKNLNFDASRSSSVYGNSDTVQPRAIGISWCIQVYNATNILSTQESAQLATQMQNKAQKDLANVISNIDFVIESYNDGEGNWYRKYRSGWVEQGGYIAKVSSSSFTTVTFLVEMQDTNYIPTKMSISNNSSTTTERGVSCYELTTNTMQIYCIANSIKTYWKIEGYAATR